MAWLRLRAVATSGNCMKIWKSLFRHEARPCHLAKGCIASVIAFHGCIACHRFFRLGNDNGALSCIMVFVYSIRFRSLLQPDLYSFRIPLVVSDGEVVFKFDKCVIHPGRQHILWCMAIGCWGRMARSTLDPKRNQILQWAYHFTDMLDGFNVILHRRIHIL
jgi:hypothetical protein